MRADQAAEKVSACNRGPLSLKLLRFDSDPRATFLNQTNMSRFLILHTAGAGSTAYEVKRQLEHCSSASTVVEAPSASDLSSFIVRLCRDQGKFDFGVVIAAIDPGIATMVEQACVPLRVALKEW
jgi:hypothetical protein